MDHKQTALILIGYQNDYFAPDGILHGAIEESSLIAGVLANTLNLLEHLNSTSVLIISAPIIFTPDYVELIEPVGILKTIKEMGAFKAGDKGAETIPELRRFNKRIIEAPGKRGLNAFSNTNIADILKERKIADVAIAGVVTSICVDSTGRSAFEMGYKVSILSDCTSGRTAFEQKFYCEKIFPIYAKVMDHRDLLISLGIDDE